MGQRGQSTLEWLIGAAVILGTLVVGALTRNERPRLHGLPSGINTNRRYPLGRRLEAPPAR